MRLRLCVVLAVLTAGFLALDEPPSPAAPGIVRGTGRPAEFDAPETILDGSEHGNRLYPHFADFDGDGITDRLVGVGDRLLVYRNQGTNARPEYAKPRWFDETEPSARIPFG
jgi:hypothetical protein